MILRNWYKALLVIMTGEEHKVLNVQGTQISAGDTIRFSPNAAYELCLNNSSGYACPHLGSLRSSYDAYGGIVLGNGNAPVSFDDYKLSGDVLTTVSAPSATPEITLDDNGFTATVTHTITNTGTEEITISEIGLMAKASNSSSAYRGVLVERTVLDNPIKIPAGGIGQVTYTFSFNYLTA